MSPKQFLALILFYISYLFFGASVYYTLEQELETADRAEKLEKRVEINDYIISLINGTKYEHRENEVLNKITGYCMFPVTHPDSDPYETPYIWTFYHSFYFVFTVVSTVGYGNISPNSTFGRMFMIFYAIIGLPLNAIMFANLGQIFGQTFEKLYKRYKQYKMSMNKNYVALRLSLIAQIFLYLVPGILIFIFLPACVFTYFEKWPYEISVYYSFVTLTTIGFGDYASSFQPWQPHEFGNLFIVYQIFIIIWFILGLGYLVMIMGYLIKAYKSKRMMKLEHSLSLGLKDAQNKIWNGVSHDINYLRKILNEISFARVQPVYVDEYEKAVNLGIHKSNSCPDLTLYRPEEEVAVSRRYKRTMSECHYGPEDINRASSSVSINRTQSDSDLRKIDRKRTFAGITTVEPNDLLAKVANALGQLQPTDDDPNEMGGVHGFSDSEILASERTWAGWSNVPPGDGKQNHPRHRIRATSETKLPVDDQQHGDAYEWTWSGANNQIPDLMKLRQKSRYNDLYRASFHTAGQRRPSEPMAKDVTIIPMPISPENTITSGQNKRMGRFNIFRKRTSSTSSNLLQQLPSNIHEDAIKYLKATSGQYPSTSRYQNSNTLSTSTGRMPAGSRRGSIFESLQSENSEVLENTTIADLIKALEAVHTQATLQDMNPKRKLGTASFTPPKIPSVYDLFDPTPDRKAYETYNPSLARRGSMFPSINNFPSSRRSSLMPTSMTSKQQPPPYTTLEAPVYQAKRRFSVRPAPQITYSPHSSSNSLNSASGTTSLQVPPITRKLSLKPSPLARDPGTNLSFRDTSRFPKPKSLQREVIDPNARNRHGSLSNLEPKANEKKRYDSK